MDKGVAVKAKQGAAVWTSRHNAPADSAAWPSSCRRCCRRCSMCRPTGAVLLREGLVAAKAVLQARRKRWGYVCLSPAAALQAQGRPSRRSGCQPPLVGMSKRQSTRPVGLAWQTICTVHAHASCISREGHATRHRPAPIPNYTCQKAPSMQAVAQPAQPSVALRSAHSPARRSPAPLPTPRRRASRGRGGGRSGPGGATPPVRARTRGIGWAAPSRAPCSEGRCSRLAAAGSPRLRGAYAKEGPSVQQRNPKGTLASTATARQDSSLPP